MNKQIFSILSVVILVIMVLLFQKYPVSAISGHFIQKNTYQNFGITAKLFTDKQLLAVSKTSLNGYFEFRNVEPGNYELYFFNEQYCLGQKKVSCLGLPIKINYTYKDNFYKPLFFLELIGMLLALLPLFLGLFLLRRFHNQAMAYYFLGMAVIFFTINTVELVQIILAWFDQEILAANLYVLKHFGLPWFGLGFLLFWLNFPQAQKYPKWLNWIIPLSVLESLVMVSWSVLGADQIFKHCWGFSYDLIRNVVVLQLFVLIGFGLNQLYQVKTQEVFSDLKNTLELAWRGLIIFLIAVFGLVLIPLLVFQGKEFFIGQYNLIISLGGTSLFALLFFCINNYIQADSRRAMERSAKLASLGTLSAGLAHEIKNPLAVINNLVKLLPEKYKEKQFRNDFMEIVPRQLDRINGLLADLLSFAKPAPETFSQINLAEILKKVEKLLTIPAKKAGVQIQTELDPEFIYGNAQALEQVFINLGLNAIQAMPNGGNLYFVLYRKNKEAVLEIQDTGVGIPKQIQEKIFDPFFTTKNTGTGLGLSISLRILESHKAKLKLKSKPGQGTTFTMVFKLKN